MSSKCLVPNCENTVGIPFPKNSDLKKGWLKALKIIDAIPDEESFICLDHFDKKDVCEILDAEARICRSIKEGAIPIITPPNEEIASQESSYVSDTAHIKEEADTIHSEYTGENRQNDNENFLADHRVKGIKTGFISKQMCTENIATQISPNNIKNSDVPEVVLFNAEDCTICRLCGTEGYSMKNIFKEKIENVLVSVAIMECIYPIEILETDRLSKYICNHCLQTLTSYFKFRSICLENDKQQRDIDLCGPINNAYTDDSSVAGPSTSDCLPARKRKAHEDNSNIADKKQRFVEIFTDSEEDYSDADLDSLSDFIIHNEPEIKTYSRKKAAPKKNVVDKNFVKVEEELEGSSKGN
ncbi:hypothetical protein NQ317_003167 [Molorchus minor]|uniref:THAP-type domain-containing protein n=1 Tax=Molorchus minor TaxID=1323400 RepID=A0ABQ9JDG5_9CUCU|nr:hypothetical protein NQ317_003167 [Molorchus minor]